MFKEPYNFLFETYFTVKPMFPLETNKIPASEYHQLYYSILYNLLGEDAAGKIKQTAYFPKPVIVIAPRQIVIRTVNNEMGNQLVSAATNHRKKVFFIYNEKEFYLEPSEFTIHDPQKIFDRIKKQAPTKIAVKTVTPILKYCDEKSIYNYIIANIRRNIAKIYNFDSEILEKYKVTYLRMSLKLISPLGVKSYVASNGVIRFKVSTPLDLFALTLAKYTGIGLKRSYGFGIVTV